MGLNGPKWNYQAQKAKKGQKVKIAKKGKNWQKLAKKSPKKGNVFPLVLDGVFSLLGNR